MATQKASRKPIVIDFYEPVSDDTYLGVAAAVMALLDLAGDRSGGATMTIDPALDDAYDEMDPFGPKRKTLARRRRGRTQ